MSIYPVFDFIMIRKFVASLCVISWCILCKANNYEYSFGEESFNFTSWQQSIDGFQCARDHQYVIMCKFRLDTTTDEIGDCELQSLAVQCAQGTMMVMFALIAIETITLGVLLLYIYKKPKIDAREREKIHKWLIQMSKFQEIQRNSESF